MTMHDIAGQIDLLLAERRPDRYAEGDDEWLDLVADEIAGCIPTAEARVALASSLVRAREGTKLKAANRLVRDMRDHGGWEPDWIDNLCLPIKVGKERVALRAATADDLRQFAADERRRAANDFAVRNDTCEAAEWLAEQMDATGAKALRDFHQEVSS